ncbi:MAG: UxaA family hydrolase [Immundisolibacterales bacterium]|nr:UxaA family hydrolase [Immundisolibacterales bacterium]
MTERLSFDRVARVPTAGDNVAIATRRLDAGTHVDDGDRGFRLAHTVLEGHRFVREPIADGDRLLSWGLPFGIAMRPLAPGEYVCNAKILKALAERDIDFELPGEANFTDTIETFDLDERTFRAGEQVERIESDRAFEGYRRGGGRGVGTRNFVVVLALTSRTNGFARHAAEQAARRAPRGVDGVVAVTHTEGGGGPRPNNLDYVLRVLAGFMVHPNVGAVLAVDDGAGSYASADLERFMTARGYPLDHVLHQFHRIEGGYEAEVARAGAIIDGWLPAVASAERTAEPVGELRLALQCGGSDAFSGVSGNALAGWVAKEVIRHGGSANLAETDELIGAEPYVLESVRDSATARRFLEKVDNFKRYAANHGTSAEGNPSGGNNFRGLYNIALKSLGAARKKDPEVRLDYVIDYGQPMRPPGYYFMDSPGNDLESIAGQVASGSNLILFITGNGSITNFPFVPTLKFVTTSGRFELLANEMDVNAGRYNDGMEMDALGAETFELALDIASGRQSKGELAGHAQVSIWRDWPRTSTEGLREEGARPAPSGRPVPVRAAPPVAVALEGVRTDRGVATDQLALVMPTSLCSGQVARIIAEDLDANPPPWSDVSRFVALVHTEGCGSNNAVELYLRTMLGHLVHRSVRHAILLEHGCEQTHNDAVRHYLAERGFSADRFGWASVQMDGGIAKVRAKVAGQLEAMAAARAAQEARERDRGGGGAPGDGGDSASSLVREKVGAEDLRIALTANGPLPDAMGEVFGRLAAGLVAAGATVVVPDNPGLFDSAAFLDAVLPDGAAPPAVSLAFGQPADERGFHVMEAPTENPVETFTGLGATGCEIMLCHVGRTSLQAHPMIPLVQVTADSAVAERFAGDLDRVLTLERAADGLVGELAGLVADAASGRYRPRLWSRGVTEFQLTRGRLGLSM